MELGLRKKKINDKIVGNDVGDVVPTVSYFEYSSFEMPL